MAKFKSAISIRSLFHWVFKKTHSAPAPDLARVERKTLLQVRREKLCDVVRKVMLRNGFLSASYKFKVLSLDAYGLQFLVMVDLIDVLTEKHFIELEAFVQESALIEHGLQVPAVYWRARELASHVKSPPKRAQRNFTEDLTRARAARAAQVAQAVPAPAPASTQFKPAVTRIFQRTGSSERGTGFADTEILEGEETLLSRTQFAAL